MSITRISIHALLAESDLNLLKNLKMKKRFQSTLSLRRATSCPEYLAGSRFISIHALLAESDLTSSAIAPYRAKISIHALLAESDEIISAAQAEPKEFQSTLSLRRATGYS